MSDGYKCDGCGELFAGKPARSFTELDAHGLPEWDTQKDVCEACANRVDEVLTHD